MRLRALLTVAVALTAFPAQALVDIPTSDRQAREVTELAESAGVARPAGLAQGPVDDERYLEAYRELKLRGLLAPYGERIQGWAAARRDGRLHWEPLRPLLRARVYAAGEGVTDRVLPHSSGDALDRGLTAFLSATGAAFWGDRVGGLYEVRGRVSGGNTNIRVKRLYLKGMWGAWSLKVGRGAERLGPGYHGSLLLGDSAPTYDYWRIRTERPLFLPGRLAGIGGFRFTLFNAYLSDDNPEAPDPRYGSGKEGVHDPRLLGMRLSYHPTRWLDLGISRTALYGGKGRETYDTPRDWWELLTAVHENVDPGGDERYDNDQYVALDVTVRLPLLNGLGPLRGGRIYWEYGATDIISRWQGENTGNWEPFQMNRVANLGGLYLSTALTDLRFEFAETGPSWYRNGQYPQGYTYRGRPLGHPMGGDARSWYLQISRYLGREWRAAASLDLQERGRSLATPEHRAEWGLTIEARRIPFLPFGAEGRIDALAAKVGAPLDDPDREDRFETYLGASVRTFGW